MKSTVAKYDGRSGRGSVELHEIDASLIQPTARTYGKKDGPAKKDAGGPGKPAPSGAPALAGV